LPRHVRKMTPLSNKSAIRNSIPREELLLSLQIKLDYVQYHFSSGSRR